MALVIARRPQADEAILYVYRPHSKRINRVKDFCISGKEGHVVISNKEKMRIRKAPLVFTEQVVAMLSGVLNSDRAIMVNIQIMRTFTKMREMLTGNDELRRRIEFLEKQYDEKFGIVFEAIRRLIDDEHEEHKEIGFKH